MIFLSTHNHPIFRQERTVEISPFFVVALVCFALVGIISLTGGRRG